MMLNSQPLRNEIVCICKGERERVTNRKLADPGVSLGEVGEVTEFRRRRGNDLAGFGGSTELHNKSQKKMYPL